MNLIDDLMRSESPERFVVFFEQIAIRVPIPTATACSWRSRDLDAQESMASKFAHTLCTGSLDVSVYTHKGKKHTVLPIVNQNITSLPNGMVFNPLNLSSRQKSLVTISLIVGVATLAIYTVSEPAFRQKTPTSNTNKSVHQIHRNPKEMCIAGPRAVGERVHSNAVVIESPPSKISDGSSSSSVATSATKR
ncbi:hypothetical protein SeMB42_g07771 [Synchytrium endobioticum]|uniref:Uncharacterized protein n=1 Tax=Synchytrium endobioticum TaxID=286115 RepID=A0A507C191_9FUNG|nr:hypothetical protein SeMB42_g07771 [Synchytrium endobioticum]